MLLLSYLGTLPYCDDATNRDTTYSTFSTATVDEAPVTKQHLNQPKSKPAELLVTQMQPPMLQPPSHQNFKSIHLQTQQLETSEPLLLSNSEPPITHSEVLGVTAQYLIPERQLHLTLTSSHTQFQHEVNSKLLMDSDSQGSNIHALSLASEIAESFTETFVAQPPSKDPEGRSFAFFKSGSYLVASTKIPATKTKKIFLVPPIQPLSSSQAEWQQSQSHPPVTKRFYQSYHEPMSTQIYQTKLRDPAQLVHWKTNRQSLSKMSQSGPQQSFTQSLLPELDLDRTTIQHSPTYTVSLPSSVTKQQSQINIQTLPTLPQVLPTVSPSLQSQLRLSPTQKPLLHSQAPVPQMETFTLVHSNSISTIYPPNQTSKPSTMELEIPIFHQVQQNTSKQGDPEKSAKPANGTELTEWIKTNTSQSPMTNNDPRLVK